MAPFASEVKARRLLDLLSETPLKSLAMSPTVAFAKRC
jgi:hypothetical protein